MGETTWRLPEVRIESVTAIAFGPIKDQTLELSPGLTVVYGPNEAGKSSWHAAIYAGLCGLRRSRGARNAKDKEFIERHQPWGGVQWEVRLLLKRDSGQRLELRQDLANLANCSAIDADFGSDVTAEILSEGTPDSTIWLGLDRSTFPLVACVRQADLHLVEDDADALQQHLERAAASSTMDSTAAQAIERLEEFRKENIGREQSNSTKPLQMAKARHHRVEETLQRARRLHEQWLGLREIAVELRQKVDHADNRHRRLLAIDTRRQADGAFSAFERARSIAERFPDGPPVNVSDRTAIAQDVSAALSEWGNRPTVPPLDGESADAIRARLDALPAVPDGDVTPAPEVVELKAQFDRAVHAVDLHGSQRPNDPEVATGNLGADELRALALDLETPVPVLNPDLATATQKAHDRLNALASLGWRRQIAGGAVLVGAIAATGSFALGYQPLAVALVFVALAAVVLWWLWRPDTSESRLRQELAEIEAQTRAEQRAIDAAKVKVQTARRRVESEGLPTIPSELRRLADLMVVAKERQDTFDAWIERASMLKAARDKAEDELREALQARGVTASGEVAASYSGYVSACSVRSKQAAKAGTRPAVQQQLAAREAAEHAVADARSRRAAAEAMVIDLARSLALTSGDAEQAAGALRSWQVEHAESIRRYQSEADEYAELQALLAGGTLQELETQVAELRRRAEESGIRPASAGADEFVDASSLEASQRELVSVKDDAARAEAQADQQATSLPSVTEAEEEVEAAAAELTRCRRLDDTITETLKVLRAAAEKVHRDIAPLLAASLKEWIPMVTRGRYRDVKVDPRDLRVQLLAPDQEWRGAENLSHGTLEQVYLLLRVVLTERLVAKGESCPVLLDDVLVHCDRTRKQALLDVIKAVSTTRQVILFTQEEEVWRWAETNQPPDKLIVLPGPTGVAVT